MTTKKTAKPAKTSKPATVAKPKSNTKASTKTTAKTSNTKSATKPSIKKPTPRKKPQNTSDDGKGRIIAIIIGIIAAVALVGIGIYALVTSINNNGKNNMTVETGSGEKIETQYLGFNDFSFRLKIPKAFHALTNAEIKAKYKNNIPDIVYANADNTVNIAIALSDTEVPNDQIKTYISTMQNTLLMLNNSKILSTDTYSQGEHIIGTIEFVNDSTEGKYYNNTAVFSQDDKLNTVTFNVKDMEREEWQPVAEFVIKSLDFIR